MRNKKTKTRQIELIAEDRFYQTLSQSKGLDDMPLEIRRLIQGFFKAGFAHGVRFLCDNPDFFEGEDQDKVGEL